MESPMDDESTNKCMHSASYKLALEKWSNYSLAWYNNSAYFRSYVCMNLRYEATKGACESAEAQLIFYLGILGCVGAFLSALTFFRRPFVPSDVYLYRMVGGVETVHMLILTVMHALTLYADCSISYACMLFSAHVYMTMTNGCADTVEFIVVFVCIERTVACLAPQHFHRIHRLPAYQGVAILAVLSAVPLNIVHSFDVRVAEGSSTNEEWEAMLSGPSDHRYHEAASDFAQTWFYARIMDAQLVRFCVVAPLIIVSTVGSIIGLAQAAKRKRRLRGEVHKSVTELRKSSRRNDPQWKAADRSRKEIKQMIDLCCLQLCLAIPVVINYLLCMVERACKTGIADRNKLWEEAFLRLTYQQARAIIVRATMLEYLRFSISVTHMLAHGLHFYLYLLFSAKFRQTFARWMPVQKLGFMFSRLSRNSDGLVSEGVTTDYERVPMTTGYSYEQPVVEGDKK